VAGVQFRLDGANLGAEDTTSPYSVSWNTTTATNGTHTLTAVARDAAGNSTTWAGVTVTVSNDTPPPPPPPSTELPRFSNPYRITNPYFPYFPVSDFTKSVLRGTIGTESVRVERTLRYGSRRFTVGAQSVRPLVMVERTLVGGVLDEVALSYLAQADDGAIYQFGVDVNVYSNGAVVGHEGSWLYGVDTNQLGIIIPANRTVGTTTYEAVNVPGIIEKDGNVESVTETVTLSSGTFSNCLKIREVYSDGTVEYKYYAPRRGLIKEVFGNGELNLSSRLRYSEEHESERDSDDDDDRDSDDDDERDSDDDDESDD
jgi:hypothetical protein